MEYLTSLQYQIEKDKERLAKIESNIQKAKIKYEPVRGISKTYQAIDNAGKKNPLTGNYSVTKDDYDQLTALAREGISSRVKIGELRAQVRHYQDDADRYCRAFNRIQDKYDKLSEKCRPFLQGLEHFPDVVQRFVEHINSLLSEKEKAKRKRSPKARSSRDR